MNPQKNTEFVSLMALLMSMVALAIDAMLPALTQIGESLKVENPNDSQLVISSIFAGMSFGLILYGPLSDSYGRKKIIYLGMSIFLLGSLLSLLAQSLTFMLLGRVLQGFGAASCRVVTTAMIKDKFDGKEMGKVMSLIMMFFIMVPALAPSIGQLILTFFGWRAIFGFFLLAGSFSILWLYFRQAETLVKEKRLPFSTAVIFSGIKETLTNPISRTYTIAAGIIFGSFVGYLSSSQQILQIQYKLGDSFSLYFGGLALVIGLSSFANSQLLVKFSMETLCLASLSVLSITSGLFFFYSQSSSGQPNLIFFMSYLAITFFCFGILFGNFNTLALQPLGHIAGVANSMISSVQTLISVGIGGTIGQYYDGTIIPLVFGFFICATIAFAILSLHIKSTPKISK